MKTPREIHAQLLIQYDDGILSKAAFWHEFTRQLADNGCGLWATLDENHPAERAWNEGG